MIVAVEISSVMKKYAGRLKEEKTKGFNEHAARILPPL